MTWETAPLGEVLRQSSQPESVDKPETALLISVRLHGKGAVRRVPGEGKAPKAFVGNRGRAGQLVYSRIWARRGAIAVLPVELDGVVVTNEFPLFDIDDGRLDSNFLSHYTRTSKFVSLLENASRGASGQNRVRESEFLTLPVPLPPLPEQRRIAAILDEADALRQLQSSQVARVVASADAAFHRLENTLAGATVVTLDKLAEVSSGITKGRKPPAGPLTAVDYLTVANVQDRRLDLTVVKQFDVSPREMSRYRLEPGDLLLTEGGDPDKLGRGVVWGGELPSAIHQNHVFRVRMRSKESSPAWLNWEVGSAYGKKYFLRAAKQTTGIATINATQLRAFPVRIPPVDAVARFLDDLDVAQRLRRQIDERGERLDALFASLQQRAFRGEL